MPLSTQKCIPCEVGGVPLTAEEVKLYSKEVPTWQVAADAKKISHPFSFPDFKQAMLFVNKIADVAEEEGHHPDIHIHYHKPVFELWTHEVEGLSTNDFVLAAKIDLLK